MLTKESFNAFLKTLEEPPSHVMFMFATTEPHKIPITILSRCQRYDFRRIGLDSISSHLASLCRREGFEIAAESLGLIAREAGGSMRDALSLLDQLMTCAQGLVTHEQVLDILGVIDRKIIFDLADSILNADIHAMLDILGDVYDRGHDMKKLYADLLEHFRNLLIVAMDDKIEKLVDLPSGEIAQLVIQAKPLSAGSLNHVLDILFSAETSLRMSPQPKLALEMTLIKLLQTKPALPIDVLIDKLDALRQEVSAEDPPHKKSPEHDSSRPEAQTLRAASEERPKGAGAEADAPADESSGNEEEIWKRICKIVSQKNPSLAANLAKSRLKNITERSLEIDVPDNEFTINMIQREKNMVVLQQVCMEVFGHKQNIRVTVSKSMGDRHKKKRIIN
jgi:DNA polymerase-3 subunit gamma/tau